MTTPYNSHSSVNALHDLIDKFVPAKEAALQEHYAKAEETRCQNQQEHIQTLRYAGNELARVMEDILGSGMVTCQISRAVMTATIAKWKQAREGR